LNLTADIFKEDCGMVSSRIWKMLAYYESTDSTNHWGSWL